MVDDLAEASRQLFLASGGAPDVDEELWSDMLREAGLFVDRALTAGKGVRWPKLGTFTRTAGPDRRPVFLLARELGGGGPGNRVRTSSRAAVVNMSSLVISQRAEVVADVAQLFVSAIPRLVSDALRDKKEGRLDLFPVASLQVADGRVRCAFRKDFARRLNAAVESRLRPATAAATATAPPQSPRRRRPKTAPAARKPNKAAKKKPPQQLDDPLSQARAVMFAFCRLDEDGDQRVTALDLQRGFDDVGLSLSPAEAREAVTSGRRGASQLSAQRFAQIFGPQGPGTPAVAKVRAAIEQGAFPCLRSRAVLDRESLLKALPHVLVAPGQARAVLRRLRSMPEGPTSVATLLAPGAVELPPAGQLEHGHLEVAIRELMAERRCKLADVYRYLDRNGDGVLSAQDLELSLHSRYADAHALLGDVRAFVGRHDVNGDGYVTYEQFAEALAAGPPSPLGLTLEPDSPPAPLPPTSPTPTSPPPPPPPATGQRHRAALIHLHDSLTELHRTLKDVFRRLDERHEGVVTAQQVEAALPRLGVPADAAAALMQLLPYDELEAADFLRAFRLPPPAAADWDDAALDELAAWMQRERLSAADAFRRLGGKQPGLDPAAFARALRGVGVGDALALSELHAIHRTLDADNDGLVGLDDLRQRFGRALAADPIRTESSVLQRVRDLLHRNRLTKGDLMRALKRHVEGPGLVTRYHFGRALRQLDGAALRPADVEAIVRVLDPGHSGYVDVGHLDTALSQTARPLDDADGGWETRALRRVREALEAHGTDRLLQLFREMDANGDGVLSPVEFRSAVARMGTGLDADQIDRVLQLADADGTGRVDYEEFATRFGGSGSGEYAVDWRKNAVQRARNAAKRRRLRWGDAFAAWDVDGDGLLSERDFRRELPGLLLDEAEEEDELSTEQLRELFAAANTTKDGFVDRRQFLAFFSPHAPVVARGRLVFAEDVDVSVPTGSADWDTEAAWAALRAGVYEARVTGLEAFGAIDQDRDGFLGRDEFVKALTRRGAARLPFAGELEHLRLDARAVGQLFDAADEERLGFLPLAAWLRRVEAPPLEVGWEDAVFGAAQEWLDEHDDGELRRQFTLLASTRDFLSRAGVAKLFRALGGIELSPQQLDGVVHLLDAEDTGRVTLGALQARLSSDEGEGDWAWEEEALGLIGAQLAAAGESLMDAFERTSPGRAPVTSAQLRAFVRTLLPPGQLRLRRERWRALFDRVDANKDGLVDAEEFEACFSRFSDDNEVLDALYEQRRELPAVFEAVDSDGDGFVTALEFEALVRALLPTASGKAARALHARIAGASALAGLADLRRAMQPAGELAWEEGALQQLRSLIAAKGIGVRAAFAALDANGDGYVTRSELRKGLRRLHVGLTAGNIDRLLETMDKNGDGRIDLGEFVDWLSPKTDAEVAAERLRLCRSRVLAVLERVHGSAATAFFAIGARRGRDRLLHSEPTITLREAVDGFARACDEAGAPRLREEDARAIFAAMRPQHGVVGKLAFVGFFSAPGGGGQGPPKASAAVARVITALARNRRLVWQAARGQRFLSPKAFLALLEDVKSPLESAAELRQLVEVIGGAWPAPPAPEVDLRAVLDRCVEYRSRSSVGRVGRSPAGRAGGRRRVAWG